MAERYMDLGEFITGGYLAEVNRRVLHPLGLALAIERDEIGGLHLLGVQDHRDDPEGVRFANVAAAGMSGEERVLTALRAAERHSAGVRGPFTLTRQG